MSFDLCQYKNSLGIPNEGIHSYRLFGVAIVDVIMTFVGAFFVSKIFRTNYLRTTIALFILGIILHRAFCVETTIDKLLFRN